MDRGLHFDPIRKRLRPGTHRKRRFRMLKFLENYGRYNHLIEETRQHSNGLAEDLIV